MPSAAALAHVGENGDSAKELSQHSISVIYGTVRDVVAEIESNSDIFNEMQENKYARFDREELNFEKVLGRGGFCVVSEINSINLNSKTVKEPEGINGSNTRKYMSTHFMRNKHGRYAVKLLSKECRKNKMLHLKGAIDLAVETKFLAVLQHPHIIKMRGVCDIGYVSDGYFLILDRLYDTLEMRITQWKNEKSSCLDLLSKVICSEKRKNKLLCHRMGVANQLCSAMTYMHTRHIIYRDLKPENIGFDIRGDVKIFDFGLAKKLMKKDENDDGTFKLTGFTGSLRYMAPEVHKSLSYNLSADIYSFGILFWQIMSLSNPFHNYSTKLHEKYVVQQGYRPSCSKTWPIDLTKIMKRCWSANPVKRPKMKEVECSIDNLLEALSSEKIENVELDMSRKSFNNSR